jgi:peptide/nickel transport system permease protein
MPSRARAPWQVPPAGSSFSTGCGILIVLATALIMLFGPWIAPYDASQIVGPGWAPWSEQFLLGTDTQGRDFLSLLILGTRTTVGVALLAALPAFLLGSFLGLFAGFQAGWIDRFLSWAADSVIAVPPFIWLILFVPPPFFGQGTWLVVAVCAIVFAPPAYRLSHALARNARSAVSDDPAGAPERRFGQLFQAALWSRLWPSLAVELGLRFCAVYMFINAASFLHLGIRGSAAEWVSLFVDNATMIVYGDWTPFIPAVALLVVPLGVRLLINPFRRPANELYDTLNLDIALSAGRGAAR